VSKEVVTDSNQKPSVCKSEYAWLGKEGLFRKQDVLLG
jgi:hypothetical protein